MALTRPRRSYPNTESNQPQPRAGVMSIPVCVTALGAAPTAALGSPRQGSRRAENATLNSASPPRHGRRR